jgi:exopolysaccharide production protein ExoZ
MSRNLKEMRFEPGITGTGKTSQKSGAIHSLGKWFEMPDSPDRMLAMEGMRGLAVILVFFVHFDTLFGSWIQGASIIRAFSKFAGAFGHTGVDLFFVLSGFLIYGITLKKSFRYGKFLFRRIQRLFPAFLTVLGIYLFLSFLLPDRSKITGSAIGALIYILENIAMLPGIFRITPIITVAWSLSYELIFYVTIPIIIGGFAMRGWTAWRRTVFFLILASGFSIFYALGFLSHHRLILFGAGIILWELAHNTNFPSKLPPFGEALATLCFAANLAMIGIYGMRTMDTQLVLPATKWWYSAGLFVTVFWLSFYALQYNGYLKKFFCFSPLRWLGNMSYSYYLIHGLALHGMRRLAQHLLPAPPYSSIAFACILLTGFVVTLAASSVLFLLVEKPLSLSRRRPMDSYATR